MQKKKLSEIVRDEIVAGSGALPFVRFMELALYCPNLGYYETKGDTVGRRGDFYTSVSVGELFGELLAFQFAEWLEEMPPVDSPLTIVEAGAHDGQLARDILAWFQSSRPALFANLEYCILEPSARRRERQCEILRNFAPKVRWLPGFNAATEASTTGIIFSNELLDAFPVRRLGWNADERKWFEWGVAAEGEKFVWTKIRLAESDTPLSGTPSRLLDVLPNDFTLEISTAATAWWRLAARGLKKGKLLTADYGLDTEDLFIPSRPHGTLRGFYRHHFADNVLANLGEQDLTAHVNFSDIQRAGEDAGLTTEFLSNQGKFLTQILERTSKNKNFRAWTSRRGRQFQTLTHPEHLGQAFRVLVQSR